MARLGLRLTLASAITAAVMVPFMVLLVVARMPLNDFDRGVAHDLHVFALQHPTWTDLVWIWSEVFGPWPWRIAVILAAAWLYHKGSPRLAAWAITVITLGGLLNLGVKIVVARARPVLPDPITLAPGDSFPSGHAMNAALGAGVLVLLILPSLPGWGRAVAWALAAFIVLSVAYTRVALGVHWVSDVIAGILLGVAVVLVTAMAFVGRAPAEPLREGVEELDASRA